MAPADARAKLLAVDAISMHDRTTVADTSATATSVTATSVAPNAASFVMTAVVAAILTVVETAADVTSTAVPAAIAADAMGKGAKAVAATRAADTATVTES